MTEKRNSHTPSPINVVESELKSSLIKTEMKSKFKGQKCFLGPGWRIKGSNRFKK